MSLLTFSMLTIVTSAYVFTAVVLWYVILPIIELGAYNV